MDVFLQGKGLGGSLRLDSLGGVRKVVRRAEPMPSERSVSRKGAGFSLGDFHEICRYETDFVII